MDTIDHVFIAKSNELALSRAAGGGAYFIHVGDVVRPAAGMEVALAEIVEALARLNVPGAVPAGRLGRYGQ